MQWKVFEPRSNGTLGKYNGIKDKMVVVAKITKSQKELLFTPEVFKKLNTQRVKIMVDGRARIGFVAAKTGGYKINFGGHKHQETTAMGRVSIGSLVKDFPHIRDLDVYKVHIGEGVLYINTYDPMTLNQAENGGSNNVD